MIRPEDIGPLTDFNRNTKAHLKRLRRTGRPELLTVNGKAEVVVQSASAYQRLITSLEKLKRNSSRRSTLTHSVDAPESAMVEKGPWLMQQKTGGPLERVKPFTPELRAEIDNDLTDRTIAFMKQQEAAGKPFFVYLPFSVGHAPNYPSKEFAGKSRIGIYGDKMMEGDYHVRQVLDALKELED